MSFLRGQLLAPLIATTFALAAHAQAPLTLIDAQRLAIARSAQLTASEAALAAQREMAVAAGRLPDPVLKLGIENLPVSGMDRWRIGADSMTMRRIGVMQEFPSSRKRELKVERVQQDARRAAAEQVTARATVQRETALAWVEGRYSHAMAQVLARQIEETELQIRGAEAAFRAGRGSQADVFAGLAARASMQDRLRQAQRQASSAGLMLARWAGPQAATALPTGDVPWQQPPWAGDLREHLPKHPALLMQAAVVAAAETDLRLAQAETRPDITVEAMYAKRGSAYDDMISVGVSVPLQIGRASLQNREIAARAAMLNEARARYDDMLAAEEGMLRVAFNDWQANTQRLARLHADLLPAAGRRVEAALASYRSGKAELADVLMARREEVDARMQILTLEMETARLWAQLRYQVPDPALAAQEKQP